MNGINLENNALAALAQRAAPGVLQAIKGAAQKTGVNFAYLVEQAAAESSFDPAIKAKTSSASGLYQFIERTWLGMVRDHGEKYGLGEYAAKIDKNYRVADPHMRKEILALRNDPEKAALMAGEFAASNKQYLERYGDDIGPIGATELYFAHFLGAGGAASFLKAHKDNPMAAGADLFPRAARANHNVFYDRKTGAPKTLAAIYDHFDKKFSASKDEADARALMAAIPDAQAKGSAAINQSGPGVSPLRVADADESLLSLFSNNEHTDGPLLAAFSPFAALNERRDTARAEDQLLSLLRTDNAQTRHDNDDQFSWLRRNGRGGGGTNTLMADPAQLMMMAQLATPRAAR